MSAPLPLWVPDIRTEDDDRWLFHSVYQAIGAASMCWEHVERAGVFKDREATRIGDGLLAYITFRNTPWNPS